MKNAVPSASPQKLNRKPILNVIYFVDSSKTRSFKIPLNTLRLGIAAIAVVAVWSVGSFFAMTYFLSEQRQNDLRARKYLAAIFEYQSRYEKVFEKAYPDQKRKAEPALVASEKTDAPLTKTAAAKAPALAVAPVAPEAPAQTSSTTNGGTTLSAKNAPEAPSKPLTDPNAPVATEASDTNSDKTAAANPKQNVRIKETKYKYVGDTLVLSFAIYNELKNEKADGYIWGVAKFTQDDGESTYVGAPSGISVDKDGVVSAPNASYKYSIKFYKAKILDFAVPTSARGQFTEIELVLMDKNGEKSSYKLPVTAKYTPTSSKPATSVLSPAPNVQGETPQTKDTLLEKNSLEQSKLDGARRNRDLPTPASARYEPNEP
jgi:hypothetical protein